MYTYMFFKRNIYTYGDFSRKKIGGPDQSLRNRGRQRLELKDINCENGGNASPQISKENPDLICCGTCDQEIEHCEVHCQNVIPICL